MLILFMLEEFSIGYLLTMESALLALPNGANLIKKGMFMLIFMTSTTLGMICGLHVMEAYSIPIMLEIVFTKNISKVEIKLTAPGIITPCTKPKITIEATNAFKAPIVEYSYLL